MREGVFVKISKGKAQERHFFLFNDLLLYAAKSMVKGKLNFKGKVTLNLLLVNDLPDTASTLEQNLCFVDGFWIVY
jgi:hypothetical protein